MMEITSMLSDNTEAPTAFRPQELPIARPAIAPKPAKRKVPPAAAKPEVRSKRALAATKHRLAELEAYMLTLSAFFAQGELTWQKEGILGDLRQMLRISEDHHQREMQRIWANPSLAALARSQNGGRDNSDRGRFVYDILPDPRSPSDTESEIDDAGAVVRKKKKKKKATPKPAAPAAPPAAVEVAVVPEKPTKLLVLKKSTKKATDVAQVKKENTLAPPVALAEHRQQPAPMDEMTRLALERQKLQEELARLAEDDDDDDDDGQEDGSDAELRAPTAMGLPPSAGAGMPAVSPDESDDD